LVIAAVAAKEVLRTLELPGVVEADPARTVKVLPAVAGRVVDVKVQLGDRVTEYQELATIYVGDLARTWFDSQGARPVPALTGNQIGFDGIADSAGLNRQRPAIEVKQAPAQLRAHRLIVAKDTPIRCASCSCVS
jgi:cobalt-zinc-cadmium efflux system membrane fusion protein